MKFLIFFAAFGILAVCTALPVEESAGTRKYDPDTDIEYLLYTRKNPDVPQRIFSGDSEGLANSNFDRTKPVKLTIHGWLGNWDSLVNNVITPAYLNALDVNVITVDWGKGANGLSRLAIDNVPSTGCSVARFLDWLNSLGVPFANFHVMGHSLGGHVAGWTGRCTQRGKVEYITGLDPGKDTRNNETERIHKTDGKYVEIIHTNMDNFGMTEIEGHNDFFPNGGENMAGCSVNLVCSHNRAIYYMADSLDHQGFMAMQCGNVDAALSGNCVSTVKLHMGGSKVKPALGLFHLKTNSKEPYWKG